jgi:hypothetical protein
MPFNELNSVEHFLIHQLSGVNLNQPPPSARELAWVRAQEGFRGSTPRTNHRDYSILQYEIILC